MTLRKKHNRGIVIDGTEYRWTVSSRQQCGAGRIVLIVEPQTQPSHRIAVDVPCRDFWSDVSTDHPIDLKDYRPVTPGIVRDVILSAIALGWNPTQPGRQLAFELHEDNTLTPVATK